VREKYQLHGGERFIIVLQHPETTRERNHQADMSATLDAVIETGLRALVVYPCSDHGYEGVVAAIEERRDHPLIDIHRNIDADDFGTLMSAASVLVGNSSAGLIETPYVRIPAINVGERQRGREHAENVIHCEQGKESVAAALRTALSDDAFSDVVANCRQPFGDGTAYKRVADILKSVRLDDDFRDKRFVEGADR